MKEIYFLYTLYTYFSTQSPFTATQFFFSVDLSICSFRAWKKFLVGCWSICAQLSQLRRPIKNADLSASPSILGTTRSPTVPSLDCKEAVEPMWTSGMSWRPEFVHCDVALRCRDAKETCFFPVWFCGCVVWVTCTVCFFPVLGTPFDRWPVL